MTAHANRRCETTFLSVGFGADFLARDRKEMRLDVVSESASEARPVSINEYAQEHFSRTRRGDADLFAVMGQASKFQSVRKASLGA